MNIKTSISEVAKVVSASVVLAALAACGGGGGGSSPSTSTGAATGASAPTGASSASSTTATTGNVSTPQYTSGSIQDALFTALNQSRQTCSFPALVENTELDQAAGSHAVYMADNNTTSDTETSGLAGFTATTYAARAVVAGFPQADVGGIGGVGAGFLTNTPMTNTAAATQLLNSWLGGVYHSFIAGGPATEIGIGINNATTSTSQQVFGTLTLWSGQGTTGSGPLTWPCEGATGVPYQGLAENPTPPNTSGSWGTPQDVFGQSLTDTIVMQSGTVTDSSGNTITLQVLDSATDPNKVLQSWEGVAYPTTPLTPNTKYSAVLTGTDNGVAFTRTYSFTTTP
jgi:hypothetical protein